MTTDTDCQVGLLDLADVELDLGSEQQPHRLEYRFHPLPATRDGATCLIV